MKRVAIPIHNGRLSEYFGQCDHYTIYDINDHAIMSVRNEIPLVNRINELPAWASKNGINDIITYKIDKQIISLFTQYKINLFVGIPIDTPDMLIRDFMSERITSSNSVINEIIKNN